MDKNILITSVGKRVSLVRIFQEALRKLSLQAKVYTTDMKPEMAPAGFVSDGCFKVPRVTDDNYINRLIDICCTNNIGLIIPTIDTELTLLAENKSLLREKGVEIVVSSTDFVCACRDKRKTSVLFQQLDICIPEIRDKYHPKFPLFAKPYDGSLSKDIYVIRNSEELTPEIMQHPKLIFMEYIDKTQYKEFTVDMYYGKDNKVKAIIPRERVEIRAGEINKGYTRKNYLVPFLKERMNYIPGVVGCICLQLFYNEMTHKVFGIEINPRFGGGYPLSYYAGANFAEYLLREYFLNESLSYTDSWKDNTLMLRYDSEVIIYEEEGVRF
jgi:carbamoyl-phosphate synthase large subunit